MRQGSGKTTIAGKSSSSGQNFTPEYAASLGTHQVRTRPIQVYEGRGIEAPRATTTVHKSGSQSRR